MACPTTSSAKSTIETRVRLLGSIAFPPSTIGQADSGHGESAGYEWRRSFQVDHGQTIGNSRDAIRRRPSVRPSTMGPDSHPDPPRSAGSSGNRLRAAAGTLVLHGEARARHFARAFDRVDPLPPAVG